jgi:hypothetical protein
MKSLLRKDINTPSTVKSKKPKRVVIFEPLTVEEHKRISELMSEMGGQP